MMPSTPDVFSGLLFDNQLSLSPRSTLFSPQPFRLIRLASPGSPQPHVSVQALFTRLNLLADDKTTAWLPPRFASAHNSLYPSGQTQIPPPLPHRLGTSTIPLVPMTNSRTGVSSTIPVPTSTSKLMPMPWRGILNVGLLILGLLTLFIFYPVYSLLRGTLNYQKPENSALTGMTPFLLL
jgi:hypothetical protein